VREEGRLPAELSSKNTSGENSRLLAETDSSAPLGTTRCRRAIIFTTTSCRSLSLCRFDVELLFGFGRDADSPVENRNLYVENRKVL